MRTPQLRFYEFDGSWEQKVFGDVFERITRKNKENNSNVLTISAQQGLINQKDYFNKSVSAKDVTGYYLLQKDDFAYNKSYSKGYPLGAIKRLKRYDTGVVSTLYICFKTIQDDVGFLEQFFNSGIINHEIHKIAQEGARNHGLLNISVIDFFKDVKLNIPAELEQQKISEFLSVVDKKIEQLCIKQELLGKYKTSLMQKILSQEIRFKPDSGNSFLDWKERKLSSVLSEHKQRKTNNEEVFSVSVHKGLVNQIEHLGRSFSAKNTDNYNLVKPGDIVYTKSPTGEFPYGIIKQSKINKNVIVSPLYGVFTPETPALGYILNVFFESKINVHNYLYSIVQKGAKNTINITNNTFLSKTLMLPVDKTEQAKISSFLLSIDNKIERAGKQLDEFKQFKKALLQQMFI